MLGRYLDKTDYVYWCGNLAYQNFAKPTLIIENINRTPAVIALGTPALSLIYYNDLTWNSGVKYGKISRDTWLMKLPKSMEHKLDEEVIMYGFDRSEFIRHSRTADPVYLARKPVAVLKEERYMLYSSALKEFRVNVEIYK